MIETWKNDFMEFVNSLNLSRDDYKTMMEYIDEIPAVQSDHNADISKKAEGDCISRKAALDAFGLSEKTRKYGGDHSGYDTRMLYEIQDTLEGLPAVQPEPHEGHWIGGDGSYICSECNGSPMDFINTMGASFDAYVETPMNYCPNCGADMRGGDSNE